MHARESAGAAVGVSASAQKSEFRRFGCEDLPSTSLDQRLSFLLSVADAVSEAVQVGLLSPGLEGGFSRGRLRPGFGVGCLRCSLQYNRPPERPSVENFCSLLEGADSRSSLGGGQQTEEEKLLDALAEFFRGILENDALSCRDADLLAATKTELGEPFLCMHARASQAFSRGGGVELRCRRCCVFPDNSYLSSARLWLWQCCTEFGFWQVGSRDGCGRGRALAKTPSLANWAALG